MSQITQCPACSTMFKVVPDQLRISEGWVRCGLCNEVFDASASLHSEFTESVPQTDQMGALHRASALDLEWGDAALAAPSGQQETSTSQRPWDTQPSELDHRDVVIRAEARQSEAVEPALDDFLSQSPQVLAQTRVMSEPPSHSLSLDAAAIEPLAGPAPRFTQSHPPAAEQVQASQPSFMRRGRKRTIWHKTSVRLVLGLVCLLLTATLIVQLAIQQRDRWAAYRPSTIPALQALCEVLACQLRPYREIDAIVINSSSFTKVGADVYRLSVALKNSSAVPVAPPALELTLTDMQDQSLIRRVFQPQDMGFKTPTLEPGAEFSAVLPLSVKTASSSERVSGYRLIAFYP